MTDPIPRLNAALEGRYRIERELGAGGMATVYLADDLRHERKVAIKVLKSELAAVIGADRFLGEIRTTANLQHPHILPLFDSGEADGFLYYVMPYVEGESLRSRLDREKQLPVEQAVSITTSVATALQAAHDQGIVHRDIKPANILLAKGEPLVADFGIALAVGPTEGSRLTETGMSLGTPHYMSPEQATGEEHVGPATDLYALGCVLFEMLAGTPPFTGPNAQAVLARVLTEQPRPIAALRRSVPPHVAAAVAKALEKLPADRFNTAGALSLAIEDRDFRWPPVSRAWGRGSRVTGLAAALVLVAGLGLWGWLRPLAGPSAPPNTSTSTSFVLPEGQLLSMTRNPLDISSDGRRIVYVGEEGTSRRLYVRDLGGFDIRPIAGTDGGIQPSLSPDGARVGFFADGAWKVVTVEDGIPVSVVDMPSGRPPQWARAGRATWTPDGAFVYGSEEASLWRVPATGGEPQEIRLRLADPDRQRGDGSTLRGPTLARALAVEGLAVARRVLVQGEGSMATSEPMTGLVDLSTGDFHPVPELGSGPWRYDGVGHLVVGTGTGSVEAIPVDLAGFRTTGPAIPLVDDVLRPAGNPDAFAFSESGTLAYATGGVDRRLVIVDRAGRETPVAVGPRGYRFPSASRDGKWVAVTVDPFPSQIWVVDLERETEEPITTGGHNLTSSWTPDGSRLYFTSATPASDDPNPAGGRWLRWPEGGEIHYTPNFSASDWLNNEQAIGGRPRPNLASDIVRSDLTTGTVTDVLASAAEEIGARISRDGNWIAFYSDQTGEFEVYVIPLSGATRPVLISSGGGAEPKWSTDGSEIFYRVANQVWAVPVRTTPTFEILGEPELLFSGPWDFSQGSNWDVLPDGRFIFIRGGPNLRREIRIVTNAITMAGQAARQ